MAQAPRKTSAIVHGQRESGVVGEQADKSPEESDGPKIVVGPVGIATEQEQGFRMGIGIVVRKGEGRQEIFSRSEDIPPIELQMSRKIKPAQPIVLADRDREPFGIGHEKALLRARKIPFFAIGVGNG